MNKLSILTLLTLYGAVLTDSCSTINTYQSCAANSACKFTQTGATCTNKCPTLNDTDCQANSSSCNFTQGSCNQIVCAGNTSSDCTSSGSVCKFTPAVEAICSITNPPQPGCDGFPSSVCNNIMGQLCSWNGEKCALNTSYCTVTGSACTNPSECTYSKGSITKCINNTSSNTCTVLNTSSQCSAQTGCTWTPSTCANKNSSLCTGSESESICSEASKFCSYNISGTCATSTSSGSNSSSQGSGSNSTPNNHIIPASSSSTNGIYLSYFMGCVFTITFIII